VRFSGSLIKRLEVKKLIELWLPSVGTFVIGAYIALSLYRAGHEFLSFAAVIGVALALAALMRATA